MTGVNTAHNEEETMHNEPTYRSRNTPSCTALTLAAAFCLAWVPGAALAQRGKIPVLTQITRNTMGDVQDVKLRSELGTWVTFTSNGDVLGAGTETTGREVYLYGVTSGTITKVTQTPGGESYASARVTDSTFSAGRPDVFYFVSTGDFDPNRDNSDGNAEIFLYEVASGRIKQLTDTQAPVVNSEPFASDSGKCIVFSSTGDLDNNDGSDSGNLGMGFRNADGSQEVFLYTVNSNVGFPYDGYFTQISSGPLGTTSRAPVIGGYWFPRQCQTTAFLSDHDQLNEGATGERIYTYDRPGARLKRMQNAGVSIHRDLDPDGIYGPPHISSASNFARGPYVVFSTEADVWNNGLQGLEAFRYRVFHPRMTQYTGVQIGDVFKPQISDGGGYIAFHSTGELLGLKHGAKHFGPGPYNADHNSEIFELKGRRRVWQITESTGCSNYDVSIQDHGGGIAFISTCDLVPGNNPAGLPQAFLWRRVKPDDPVLAPGACQVGDGCCNEANGCYRELLGRQDRPPKRNRTN
jgi:hypothetical protein